MEVSCHSAQANIDNNLGGGQTNVDAVVVEYTLDNGLMVYAAVGDFDVTMLRSTMENDHLALGLGYDFARRGPNLPGILTVEMAQNDSQ